MKQFIEAGEFVTTHGVMGELKLYPWGDGPEFVARFRACSLRPRAAGRRRWRLCARTRACAL
ncbi:MAG: hypothetical protein V8T36_03000 [Ruthenibacterium lactatiformans]